MLIKVILYLDKRKTDIFLKQKNKRLVTYKMIEHELYCVF